MLVLSGQECLNDSKETIGKFFLFFSRKFPKNNVNLRAFVHLFQNLTKMCFGMFYFILSIIAV